MAELARRVDRALTVTASIVVSELFNEGKSAAADPVETPYAVINEILDADVCPLCRAVHGKVLKVGSPEYRQWRQPSHINCRRTLDYIPKEAPEPEPQALFQEPDPELVRKHGHFHRQPDRYVELRVPAEPGGRHFIFRRVKNLETGAIETRLDWAPWWQQVPEWKRKLVFEARAAGTQEALTAILARLGITDLTDPEQLRQSVLLGLRDRLDGWVTDKGGPARGKPVSQALTIRARSPVKEEAQKALDLIDEVHGDGDLPVIPLTSARTTKHWGAYAHRGGQAVDIEISTLAPGPELTTVHEVGHFLDHHGMGKPGEFSSHTDDLLQVWRERVLASESVKTLQRVYRYGYIEGEDEDGSPLIFRVERSHLEYLLRLREIWARSYAQYIALRSGDSLLREQLESIRNETDLSECPFRHWSDEDFTPIASAIDDLFVELGWRKRESQEPKPVKRTRKSKRGSTKG